MNDGTLRLGLTFDLREAYLARGYGEEETAEFDAPETIEAIEQGLQRLGYTVERIGALHDLVPALAASARWDLVFNIAEGLHGYGREAAIPALLEAYRIPCVFSDPLSLAVTLHKGVAKRLVRDQGLPTPAFMVVERVAQLVDCAADAVPPFPLFVKPVAEGTGKGVGPGGLVHDHDALAAACGELIAAHRQPALVEAWLPGREVTVGVVGTGPQARVLGVMEVLLNERADPGCYSYRNKAEFHALVRYRLVEDDLAAEAGALALAAYRALDLRDAGRVDLRQDASGRLQFLEVNPLPGLHPDHSDLPILCALAGVGYQELLSLIMESAVRRLRGVDVASPLAPVVLVNRGHAA